MADSTLRSIPSVDRVVREIGETGVPRPVVVGMVRRMLDEMRADRNAPDLAGIVALARTAVEAMSRARIQPVVNGTGILIHTNFGRSPLGPAVVRTLVENAENYNSIEYSLGGGERGPRAGYLAHNLALL